MPPMGVARGVAPNMGVAPTMGVAPPRPMPGPAGVSSHRDLPRLLPGVAATAGVSPGAHPGVAPPSACAKEHGHPVCQSHICIPLLRHAEGLMAHLSDSSVNLQGTGYNPTAMLVIFSAPVQAWAWHRPSGSAAAWPLCPHARAWAWRPSGCARASARAWRPRCAPASRQTRLLAQGLHPTDRLLASPLWCPTRRSGLSCCTAAHTSQGLCCHSQHCT